MQCHFKCLFFYGNHYMFSNLTWSLLLLYVYLTIYIFTWQFAHHFYLGLLLISFFLCGIITARILYLPYLFLDYVIYRGFLANFNVFYGIVAGLLPLSILFLSLLIINYVILYEIMAIINFIFGLRLLLIVLVYSRNNQHLFILVTIILNFNTVHHFSLCSILNYFKLIWWWLF